MPPGHWRNLLRREIGVGEEAFVAAAEAIQCWSMFPGNWIEAGRLEPRVHQDQTVAVMARCLGIWAVNACRVLYIFDEKSLHGRRYAFIYATLEDHMIHGAERFCVEWDRTANVVWYDLQSYARPRHPLVWLVFPYFRRLQRRFARELHARMAEAVRAARGSS